MAQRLSGSVLVCGWVLLAFAALHAGASVEPRAAAAQTAAVAEDPAVAAERAIWAAKSKTDQSISLDVTVEATPAEVYRLWTTAEGVMHFMAPAATIDSRLGGRYQVMFDPQNDPDGRAYGTWGCRVLRLEPNHSVAFEWTFPPLGAELNTQPFPTWVEIQIDPVIGQPGQTVVRLQHFGFPHSEKWDKCFALFRDKNWPHVLATLKTYCQKQAHRPAP